MKALVTTGVKELDYCEWPDPQLEPGDALVRVQSAGVCGSDLRAWRVQNRKRVPPFILGHELAGDVIEIRDPLCEIQPGDSVAIYPIIGCHQCPACDSGQDNLCVKRRELGLHVAGGFARYLKIPATSLYAIPKEMGFTRGALIEPVSVALHMVSKTTEHHGPAVIMGAGPVGLFVLQVARHMGFPRIAVAEVNVYRSRIAAALGADLIVNPTESAGLELLQQFLGAEGCAVVFDAAGFSAARQLALKLVRTGGLIVLAGGGDAGTSLDFGEVIGREIRIQGSCAYNRQDFQSALEFIAEGRVNLEGWVSEAALAEGQKVFEELTDPGSKQVKVVLKP